MAAVTTPRKVAMSHHSIAESQRRSSCAPPNSLLLALSCGAAVCACTGELLYPPEDTKAEVAGTSSAPSGTDGSTGAVRSAGGSGGGSGDPAAAGGAAGADDSPQGPPSSDCSIIDLQARAILEKNCAGCHGPGTNVANFDTVLDLEKLKASGKIKPGNPDSSPLYKRLASNQMPPPTQAQRPSAQEIALIYNWIESCTADPVAPGPEVPGCGGPPIDLAASLSAMVGDIARIELADRRFIRYFTLTHLHDSGVCEKDMAIYRAALAKAVNALSLGTQVVAPEAIDQYGTIYRIDLRDYEWDASGSRADKWQELVAQNPYAVEYVEDDAEVLKTFSGTSVPFQAGDWFVNAATHPPLYHALLDIPKTRAELEDQLGIDIQVDIENADVWRAGFINSAISAQNRVIERHQLPTSNARAFWISYDFAGNGGRENIFADPLDFEADGSEIIFTLPNGFHAYMVANAAGTRLDEAPDSIVVDPRQRDHNVTNGISCMGCHDAGMKTKDDEIRAYVANSSDFNAAQKREVDDLYPTKAEFAALISRDSKLFLESVESLSPPQTAVAEPIIEVFSRFDENVDLKRAAAELNVSPERLLRELGGLNPALAPLGYADIKRDTFREVFAETVCLLNLGLTQSAACAGAAR